MVLRNITKWYLDRTRWFSLSTVGEAAWVKASVVMPIFGYLVILNSELLKYAEIDPRFHLFSSDNPWRLLCIYFGATFIGVASAIYQGFRPETAKYGNAVAFYNVMKDFVHSTVGAQRLAWIVGRSRTSAGMLYLRRQDRVDEIVRQILAGEATAMEDVSSLCIFVAQNDDRSKRLIACVCRVMFDVGFILLTIPAIATFFGVLSYAVRLFRL